MRALFLLLVLLNLLYALWQLQDGVTDQALLEQADSTLASGLPDAAPAPRLPAAPAPAAAQVPVPEPAAGTVLCVSLGSFTERGTAEQLRQRLLALGMASQVLAKPVTGKAQYWLVLSVAGPRSAAVAKLGELQGRGIDSFLITEGPFAGHLSLGAFDIEDQARARLAQLRDAGYSARLESVDRSRSEYVVQVDSEARRLIDQAVLARLREGFPQLQHQFHQPAKHLV